MNRQSAMRRNAAEATVNVCVNIFCNICMLFPKTWLSFFIRHGKYTYGVSLAVGGEAAMQCRANLCLKGCCARTPAWAASLPISRLILCSALLATAHVCVAFPWQLFMLQCEFNVDNVPDHWSFTFGHEDIKHFWG